MSDEIKPIKKTNLKKITLMLFVGALLGISFAHANQEKINKISKEHTQEGLKEYGKIILSAFKRLSTEEKKTFQDLIAKGLALDSVAQIESMKRKTS